MTVLYVDDDPEDRLIFAEALAEVRPDVVLLLAQDGAQAIDILHALNDVPQLIFLDVNMPLMNGHRCLAEIRAIRRYSEVPIVMYSTSSSQEDVEQAESAGAYRYMKKQNSFDEIKTMILELFNIG